MTTTHGVGLPRVRSGKVRDLYAVDEDHLFMVASDRVSAFDVVMAEPIPHKGPVLTQLSAWWFERLATEGIDHHLVSADPDRIVELCPELAASRDLWAGRGMLVRGTDPVPVECVIRGYLAGSAWREYEASGTLAGEPLPEGLEQSARLPRPLFSPATKAEEGHDQNITAAEVRRRLGAELATRLEDLSRRVFEFGSVTCARHGILLADTKFEFGLDGERLLLIDEVLTPDSSRFWPEESYEVGRSQPSLDKQPIRDWLDRTEWGKRPPPPPLPPEVVRAASDRYVEVFRRITGRELATNGGRS